MRHAVRTSQADRVVGRPATLKPSGSGKITRAKELLRKREGAIADGKPVYPKSEKIRFSELAALVVDDYTINHYKSLEIIKGRLKNHIIPAFGHRKAATVTTGDLTRYVIERQTLVLLSALFFQCLLVLFP
ncbi:MAG: hypothetical protein EHM23_31720 [Acidobacteria bacterium]|nr:MAG: hypothetical protein EHM23_31720 [Acidobacteriota bacterium]